MSTTLAAWDALADCAWEVDPAAPVRKGTAGSALAELGTWPGSRTLGTMRAEASAGQSEFQASSPQVPHEPTTSELVAALRRSRDSLATWVDDPTADWQTEGLRTTPTMLGPLPLLTIIHGATYQMALVALELRSHGVEPPPSLLDTGLTALVDTTGGFAARAGLPASITARVPGRQIGTGADGNDWCTRDLTAVPAAEAGPAVIGDVATVLIATAGRADVATLYRTGSLRVHDIQGLMHWLPVLETVPGLPGAATLGRAGRYLGTVSTLLSRLPFRS
ncbi:MAG: hypothetical protein QG597_3466 [Actinomycetota bacterium]|nr:hypothetical protein [Actinomycetota bacterium]